MATPTTLPTTPNMVPGNALPDAHGTGFSQSEGINEMIADILQAWTKLGTGASTPGGSAAVLRRTGSGASAWGQVAAGDYAAGSIGNADISVTAGIDPSKIDMDRIEAALGADVNLNNVSNYFDGPSVSLTAGTWLLLGRITVVDSGAAAGIAAKLWDGTTVEDSTGLVTHGATFEDTMSLMGIVTVGSTTTWKISVRDLTATTGKILAASTYALAGNNASRLIAVRIG